jgi:hypothetical protein
MSEPNILTPFVVSDVRRLMARKTRVFLGASWFVPPPFGDGIKRSSGGEEKGHPHMWCKLAWAECEGLDPVVSWQTHGVKKKMNPWLNGAESARGFLEALAQDTRPFAASDTARKVLASLDRSKPVL